MAEVLALDGITAGYGETMILSDVSLRVNEGETVVIIGPNGAGKSTALKAALGLVNITRGEIRLKGRPITSTPPQKMVSLGVSYVPQTENVFVNLSVRENLEMGAYTWRGDLGPKIERIYAMFPDLARFANTPAGSLSGGQRQMVAMGRALMLEPVLLALDEPTAGLSPKYRGEIFELVRSINAEQVSILLVEQNAKQALGIADRAYVLVDGANAHEGTGRELLEDEHVARMFLGGGHD